MLDAKHKHPSVVLFNVTSCKWCDKMGVVTSQCICIFFRLFMLGFYISNRLKYRLKLAVAHAWFFLNQHFVFLVFLHVVCSRLPRGKCWVNVVRFTSLSSLSSDLDVFTSVITLLFLLWPRRYRSNYIVFCIPHHQFLYAGCITCHLPPWYPSAMSYDGLGFHR